MRRVVAGAVLVLLALSRSAAAGENLITGGGFELPAKAPLKGKLSDLERSFYPGMKDTPAAGWVFGGGWDGGRYTVHLSDEAHSGRHSIEIRCGKKGRGGIASSPLKLLPGTILKVSFWIKAKDAGGGDIRLNYEGTPGDGWNGMNIAGGTYDWKEITKRCVVPVRHCRADGQTLMIFIYSKTTGSIWIDDMTVETVDVNKLAESPSAPALAPPRPKDITEPPGSLGYRVDTADALVKVYPDTDYQPADKLRKKLAISLARNEVEDAQLIIEAPWRDVTVGGIAFSDLKGPAGTVIPAKALSWRRVDFVETMFAPAYQVPRVGWYPDPLMPAGEFTVKRLSRTPVWISLRTAKDTRPGVYRGAVTVTPKGRKSTTVPLTVTVWDFTVADQTHLRTLTWFNGFGWFPAHYGFDRGSAEGRREHEAATRRFWDMLLEHRLGPGGDVAAHVWKKYNSDKYDFSPVEKSLSYLIPRGMNAFIMGSAPNLKRQRKNEYTEEFIAEFTAKLKPYGNFLREQGWIDKAYVYTYDEAPKRHWGEVRKIATAIKKAAPELRILQCLNEPDGVRALAGDIDVFDVYVSQYHRTGAQAMQQRGIEAWLRVCCYPMDHPNLFIEYPLIDARILPMFCWKYKAAGFEYWSPASWGKNVRRTGKGPKWPEVPWDPNTFGRYNGDGYLLYPGPGGVPYPSIRLKSLRDGFEDYEYLWLLRELVQKAKTGASSGTALDDAEALLKIDEIIKDDGTFETGNDTYFAFREKVATSIVAMKKLLEQK